VLVLAISLIPKPYPRTECKHREINWSHFTEWAYNLSSG